MLDGSRARTRRAITSAPATNRQGYFCDIEGWNVAPVEVSEEDARSLPQVFWSRERVAKALEQLGVEGDG
jgi:hypothetical protein